MNISLHLLIDHIDYLNISLVYEKKLLGTAGTLINNLNFCIDETILIHADNVMEESLIGFCDAHKNRPKSCLMTMLTFETRHPKNCGIVEVNDNNVITQFYEKSVEDHGNLANAAIYLLSENFLESLAQNHQDAYDFSNHIIPSYLNRVYTYKTKKNFTDIGNFKQYEEALKYNI